MVESNVSGWCCSVVCQRIRKGGARTASQQVDGVGRRQTESRYSYRRKLKTSCIFQQVTLFFVSLNFLILALIFFVSDCRRRRSCCTLSERKHIAIKTITVTTTLRIAILTIAVIKMIIKFIAITKVIMKNIIRIIFISIPLPSILYCIVVTTTHRVIVTFSTPSASRMPTFPSMKPNARWSPSQLQSAERIFEGTYRHGAMGSEQRTLEGFRRVCSSCKRQKKTSLSLFTPLPSAPSIYSLGWRRLATTLKTMSLLTRARQPGYRFFFFSWWSVTAGCRVRSFVRGEQPLLRASGNDRDHVVFMARHPRGSYISLPLLSLEMATPKNRLTH